MKLPGDFSSFNLYPNCSFFYKTIAEDILYEFGVQLSIYDNFIFCLHAKTSSALCNSGSCEIVAAYFAHYGRHFNYFLNIIAM